MLAALIWNGINYRNLEVTSDKKKTKKCFDGCLAGLVVLRGNRPSENP